MWMTSGKKYIKNIKLVHLLKIKYEYWYILILRTLIYYLFIKNINILCIIYSFYFNKLYVFTIFFIQNKVIYIALVVGSKPEEYEIKRIMIYLFI
jgi:hypothetical protein